MGGTIITGKEEKVNPAARNLLWLQLRILAIKFSTGSVDQQTCDLIYKSSTQASSASLLIEFRLLGYCSCFAFSRPQKTDTWHFSFRKQGHGWRMRPSAGDVAAATGPRHRHLSTRFPMITPELALCRSRPPDRFLPTIVHSFAARIQTAFWSLPFQREFNTIAHADEAIVLLSNNMFWVHCSLFRGKMLWLPTNTCRERSRGHLLSPQGRRGDRARRPLACAADAFSRFPRHRNPDSQPRARTTVTWFQSCSVSGSRFQPKPAATSPLPLPQAHHSRAPVTVPRRPL